MFGFHVKSAVAMSASEAVKFGFLAWGLLALAMGLIFLVVLVLNKIAKKKRKKINSLLSLKKKYRQELTRT